jgi:hypothetical protein
VNIIRDGSLGKGVLGVLRVGDTHTVTMTEHPDGIAICCSGCERTEVVPGTLQELENQPMFAHAPGCPLLALGRKLEQMALLPVSRRVH